MFFEYPIDSTAENWLHDSLLEMLTTIHANIEANEPVTKWPDIIPEKRRDDLRSRRGLRDKLKAYAGTIAALPPKERQQVLKCLRQQNRISELCNCTEDCDSLDKLPEASHDSIRDIFDSSFLLLTDLGIRDQHYKVIYEKIANHVCPFCGCEYFDAPGAPREDLDHYLLKSRYPFAAANLCNLVPMGMKCNERYKKAVDILRDKKGAKRRVFYPYEERKIEINLSRSVTFGGSDGKKPKWIIEFEPDYPECLTWDEIFHVRERFERDVLDPSFNRWLGEFAHWFKLRIGALGPDAEEVVLNALRIYAEDIALLGFNAREFLRVPVFQMLHKHCRNGDIRLRKVMIDLVTMN